MSKPENYGPAESILDGLDEDDAEDIIEEVGDRIVDRLAENESRGLIERLDGEVVVEVALLERTYAFREGMGLLVGPFFDSAPESLIRGTGGAVVDEIREDQAEEVVEDIIRTTVEKMQENSQ